MRKVLFAISIVLLAYCTTQAETGPKMVVEDRIFNFGEIWEGQIVEHAFSVQNLGDQPLEIRRINPG